MQHFTDTATGKAWAFDDDVQIVNEGNVHVFSTPAGVLLKTPVTLVPASAPVVDPAAEAWTQHQVAAAKQWAAARETAIHALMLGQTVPAAWVAHAQALHAILSAPAGTPGALPVPPAVPAGL